MKSILLSLLPFLCLLLGCQTTSIPYSPSLVDGSKPELGKVTTASVGDNIVVQQTIERYEAFTLTKRKNTAPLSGYTFHPGVYVKIGESQRFEYFIPAPGPEGGHIVPGSMTGPFKKLSLNKSTGKLCAISSDTTQSCLENPPLVRNTYERDVPGSIQQVLVYNGRIGNTLHIGYREFTNDQARPAFSNEVVYELMDKTNIIRYKGCEIEVINASNQEMEYRVLKNFSPSVMKR